jgi:hypothetical protein
VVRLEGDPQTGSPAAPPALWLPLKPWGCR